MAEPDAKRPRAEAPDQPSLGVWAAGLRQQAFASEAQGVRLVSGNEASDADSIVTALVYGYYKHCTRKEADGPVVSVVMCNREDVTLRKETTLLLELCGVDFHDLVFLDDPGMEGLLGRVEEVTLTDHNKAMGKLAALGDRVVEIKDHHKDLGAHERASGCSREIAFAGDAATAGSAASVIAEAFMSSVSGRALLARDNGAAARALLGVILIDTVNLDPSAKKVCPRDTAAAVELLSIAPEPEQHDLFKRLDAAKFDSLFWDSLSIAQCCRYDYKEFTTGGKTYGLSSCLCPLEVLASKSGWAEEVASRASQLELFGVLTQVRPEDGGPAARQLMLHCKDEALTAKAAAFACAYESPCLKLEPFQVSGPSGLKAFWQRNTGASRKQVQPCLGAFFSA